MKYIICLIISIFLLSITVVSATELMPSLGNQMIKQEKINKKNAIINRIAEQVQKRKKAEEKLATLKYQKLVLNNVAKNTPISNSIINHSAPTLVISRPPVLTQLPVQTIKYLPNNIPIPSNIDMSRVRSTWIGWYNGVRQGEGIASYSYDNRLDVTAYDWNEIFMKSKGLNHHTRNPGDGYYNFAAIDTWFIAHGINPTIIDRAKHTENVGYGYYSCNSSDCTDNLIRSIRSTFDFFMSEKGKSYDPHYRSIVQPNFSKMGLSIIVVPEEHRYYLTVHYITK